MSDAPAAASFSALGTTATVAVVDHAALPAARELLGRLLDAVDLTCSRFRADSELVRVNRGAGETSLDQLRADEVPALRARGRRGDKRARRPDARRSATARRLRPHVRARTRARHLASRPEDRTAAELGEHFTRRDSVHRPRSAWRRARPWRHREGGCSRRRSDRDRGSVQDRGARLARRRSRSCRSSPDERLGRADRGRPRGAGGLGRPDRFGQTGGLATSSTTVRRWRTDQGDAHHILDPRTGRPAVTPWRTITVAAATCFEANVAATAAVVLGDGALDVASTTPRCPRGACAGTAPSSPSAAGRVRFARHDRARGGRECQGLLVPDARDGRRSAHPAHRLGRTRRRHAAFGGAPTAGRGSSPRGSTAT